MNDRTKNLLNHITDTLKKQPDVPVNTPFRQFF